MMWRWLLKNFKILLFIKFFNFLEYYTKASPNIEPSNITLSLWTFKVIMYFLFLNYFLSFILPPWLLLNYRLYNVVLLEGVKRKQMSLVSIYVIFYSTPIHLHKLYLHSNLAYLLVRVQMKFFWMEFLRFFLLIYVLDEYRKNSLSSGYRCAGAAPFNKSYNMVN